MSKSFEALASGDTLELRMYGPIGGGFFSDGVCAESVDKALKDSPHAKTITVKISSPGGAAFEGLAIRSMLAAHPASVTCEVEGLAASAASIIAMAGDKITMHAGSALMIHEASAMTRGTSKEHRQAMDALETLNDGMADIYATRSGMSKEECRVLMDAETWLTPEQAVSKKFADNVVKAKKSPTSPTSVFDLSAFGYRHVPEQFTAAAMPPQKDTSMSFAAIAQALGLDSAADESSVTTAVRKLRSAVSDIQTITGATSLDAAIGVVRANSEAAKQLPALQEQLKANADALEAQERAALIAADASDKDGPKLTPATIAFCATLSLEQFKAYLNAAHRIVALKPQPASKTQPSVVSSGKPSGATAEVTAVTHEGKSWEQMSNRDKVALLESDKDAYAALRADYVSRGEPAFTAPKA